MKRPLVFCVIYCLLSVATLSPVHADEAPRLYVERCAFQFTGSNCGEFTRQVVFLSSDELLSSTDNWAVGRAGDYKQYLSCLDPGDDTYIDGSLSLVTAVVSGPSLEQAFQIAKSLLADFVAYLPKANGDASACIQP